jgi:hypothetical protein
LSVLDDEDDAVASDELDPAGKDEEGMAEVVGGDGRRTGRGGGIGEGDGDLRSYVAIGSGALSAGVKKIVSVGDG